MKKVFIALVDSDEQVRYEGSEMILPVNGSSVIEIVSPGCYEQAKQLFPAMQEREVNA